MYRTRPTVLARGGLFLYIQVCGECHTPSELAREGPSRGE